MTGINIPYIKLEVCMVPCEPASLPEWASSTVRGAFGTRILEAFCTEGEYHCAECSNMCSAGILYGTANDFNSYEVTNPYVINCEYGSYDGKKLNFEMTLFAEGINTVDDVLAVLNSGLALGVGRVRFDLFSIKDAVSGKVIYDGNGFYQPEVHFTEYHREQAKKIMIEFYTPFKSKIKSSDFGFEQLMRAALRRTSFIMRMCGNDLYIDYPYIIKRSSEIKVKYKDIRNERLSRYSNRAGAKMDFDGFVGVLVCEGDLTEFMPFLRVAEMFHAGKMCVMGLGKIKVYVLE